MENPQLMVTLTNLRKAIRKLENLTVKGAILHVVGSSRFGSVALKMLWPFIPEQIQNKVITICIALVACGTILAQF